MQPVPEKLRGPKTDWNWVFLIHVDSYLLKVILISIFKKRLLILQLKNKN